MNSVLPVSCTEIPLCAENSMALMHQAWCKLYNARCPQKFSVQSCYYTRHIWDSVYFFHSWSMTAPEFYFIFVTNDVSIWIKLSIGLELFSGARDSFKVGGGWGQGTATDFSIGWWSLMMKPNLPQNSISSFDFGNFILQKGKKLASEVDHTGCPESPGAF